MLNHMRGALLSLLVALLACGGSIFDSSDPLKSSGNGSVCGGATIGYWSNKNGANQIVSADLEYLSSFALVPASGAFTGFKSAADVGAFLRSADAKNMANMLSAQWVAFALNYAHHYFCIGLPVTFQVKGFWVAGAGANGTVTYAQLEQAVKDALAPNTAITRAQMDLLKSFFDTANNGARVCSCALTGMTGGFTGGFSR